MGNDDADAVTVDAFGNTYLGCHSSSPNLFKESKHAYSLRGSLDAFVVKLNGNGTQVNYIAHLGGLGGSKWEAIQGLVTDKKAIFTQ